MRETRTGKGIKWTDGNSLGDLDFADDVALLESDPLPTKAKLHNLKHT